MQKLYHITLVIISSITLLACEPHKPNPKENESLLKTKDIKNESEWFNLFLPPQTHYILKPESLGLKGSFLSIKTKEVGIENPLNTQLSPDAISFFYPEYDPKIDPVYFTVETENNNFVDIKVKMFPTGPLEIAGGEGPANPDSLILKGINPETSTWNEEPILIGWTYKEKFDPEYSGVLIYYQNGRYDSGNIEFFSVKDAFNYNTSDNIWEIDKHNFGNFIKNLPDESLTLSINLVSYDFNTTEVYDVQFYKAGLQKRHLIPD